MRSPLWCWLPDLGFDFSFCVEHHFQPHESWMSSPALYAVGGGARTKRLRVGSMGFIAPLYHPLRLAEEIAIVDQMLGGRLECGLVPGISQATLIFLISRSRFRNDYPVRGQALPFPSLVGIQIKTPDEVHGLLLRDPNIRQSRPLRFGVGLTDAVAT